MLNVLNLLTNFNNENPNEKFAPQAPAPAPLRKVRFLLNSGYSGANSWFLLADQRGYFREEGLEVEFVMGRGAFTAAGRVAREGYDIGYGDVQALNPGSSSYGGYCTAKGRLLATFLLWPDDGGFNMLLPAVIAEAVR